MTEYTPTTEQVENGYVHDSEDEYRDPVNYPASVRMRRRDFQRWLAQVKAEAQVEALREVAQDAEWSDVALPGMTAKDVTRGVRARADRIAREAGIYTEGNKTGEKQ